MINAGAIMICALIVRENKNIDDILEFFNKSTGMKNTKIDMDVYNDEKETGYTNHALTSLMLAKKAFPKYENMKITSQKA